MSAFKLDHRSLYRLPWNLSDNAICWLEPTSICNMACDGCYRENDTGHKSWEEICHDLDVFQKLRTADCVSIAGGEPLMYPHIVDLVREVKRRGLKPILNTNGQLLTRELLTDLKRNGLFGVTIHIDSNQGRQGEWDHANEVELNRLRLSYAEMIASEGGLVCSFNATVYDENVKYVPEMVAWANEHCDIVHTMVFICFRHVIPDMPYDWYVDGEKVDWKNLWYHSDQKRRIDIKSVDLVNLVRETEPDFMPAAYINGTELPDSMKWLLTIRIGMPGRNFGYIGPKMMELATAFYHFSSGKYLSYASPSSTSSGRSATWVLWPFDAGMRRITRQYLRHLTTHPLSLFKKLYFQSIMFIQPVDCLADGRQNMCDSCPDLTVWNDRLVYSCRLEELKRFGTFLQTVRSKTSAVDHADR